LISIPWFIFVTGRRTSQAHSRQKNTPGTSLLGINGGDECHGQVGRTDRGRGVTRQW
jgi:hypothetical protein